MIRRYDIAHLPDGFMYGIDKEAKTSSYDYVYIPIKNYITQRMRSFSSEKDTSTAAIEGILVVFTNNPSLGLPLLPDIGIKSTTNSELGSYHNIHTLESRIAHIGEYMEKNGNCAGNEKEWGKTLRDSVKELVAAFDKRYTEEDLLKLVNKLNDKSVFTKAWIIQKIKELQSLSPKPIAVKVEMESFHLKGEEHLAVRRGLRPKLNGNQIIIKQWIWNK